MSEIKRYECYWSECCDDDGRMYPRAIDDGQFVLYSDHIKALSQRPADPAWISALTGPVTDEEWGICDVAAFKEIDAMHRKLANEILAARAKALASPVPKEKENG